MTKDPLRAPHARAVCIEQHDGWYMRARAAVLAACGLERCARIAQPAHAGQSVPVLSIPTIFRSRLALPRGHAARRGYAPRARPRQDRPMRATATAVDPKPRCNCTALFSTLSQTHQPCNFHLHPPYPHRRNTGRAFRASSFPSFIVPILTL